SYFEGFGFAAVRVEGDSRGVIDHSIFVDNFKLGIDNLGYGVVVYGDGSWNGAIKPGDAQATFVEDSLFVGNRHAIAASAGARYVFRYNQVLHGVEACGVDAHGMGYGSAHGTQFVEIYRNIIEDPAYDWCGIGIRGGSGVIFENNIHGYQNPILLIMEWGTPEKYKAHYPALDQIQGLYIWDNQVKGAPEDPRVDETGIGFIQANRDYYTYPRPDYVPYEYPHPLVGESPFDQVAWPPDGS
ncbi:MAG: right-handed parallel beta-helix repeat-containing protein, partial [Acidobacteriaceae bacterium]